MVACDVCSGNSDPDLGRYDMAAVSFSRFRDETTDDPNAWFDCVKFVMHGPYGPTSGSTVTYDAVDPPVSINLDWQDAAPDELYDTPAEIEIYGMDSLMLAYQDWLKANPQPEWVEPLDTPNGSESEQ